MWAKGFALALRGYDSTYVGPPPRRLVVEEDAVGCMHPIGLAVVDDNPVRKLLGDAWWEGAVLRWGA